ncbi:MAG: ABC transporter substrate binding protein, partial [Treponemataceae bacterium]
MRQAFRLSPYFLAFAFATVLAAAPDLSATPQSGPAKTEYRVFIVIDGLRQKFVDVQTGFQDSLSQSLASEGAAVRYTVFDTKADPATVPGIIKAIEDGKPDLICVINNSSVFADTNITRKLTDPRFNFVTENCMPVQSGVAKSWQKPGGNVTGVGVFVQFNSMIRLARTINPRIKKWAFASWKAVKELNEFLETEVRAAAKAEGVELIEFRRLADAEEEIDFYKNYSRKP